MRPATIGCCDGCLCGCAAGLHPGDSSEPMVMFSRRRLTGLALLLSKASLLIVPLVYGAFLGWQEWRYRQQLTSPMLVETPRIVPAPRQALDTTAVATVLGLTTGAERLPSAEPLTLQASFVVSHGLSRVLLA